jgi:hypothetical protein
MVGWDGGAQTACGVLIVKHIPAGLLVRLRVREEKVLEFIS